MAISRCRLVIVILMCLFATAVSVMAQDVVGWKRIKDLPQGEGNRWRTYLALDGSAESLVAVMIYDDIPADTGATVFERSTDGGRTWRVITPPGLPKPAIASAQIPTIRDVAHPTPDLIVGVGDSGMIVRSTDGGETWEMSQIILRLSNLPASIARSFTYVDFADANHGMILADLDFLLFTSDGGKTWDVDTLIVGPYGFSSFRGGIMLDTAMPLVVDFYNNVLTRRNGAGWKIDSPFVAGFPDLNGMDFAMRETQLWATAYTRNDNNDRSRTAILSSEDSGKTWHLHVSSELPAMRFGSREIDFFDGRYGILIGSGDSSLHTSDGGETWHGVYIPFSEAPYIAPMGLVMLSPTEAIAIGVNGVMIRYTAGPTSVGRMWEVKKGGIMLSVSRPDGSTGPLRVEIDLPENCPAGERMLRLFDAAGRVVADWSDEIRSRTTKGRSIHELEMPDIAGGTYYIMFESCGAVSSEPVIVQ